MGLVSLPCHIDWKQPFFQRRRRVLCLQLNLNIVFIIIIVVVAMIVGHHYYDVFFTLCFHCFILTQLIQFAHFVMNVVEMCGKIYQKKKKKKKLFLKKLNFTIK